MPWDRGLRSLLGWGYPLSGGVPSTSGINTEKGSLKMSSALEGGWEIFESPFPLTLTLWAKLLPERFQSSTQIIYTDQTQTWPAFELYQHPKAELYGHQAIQLVYQGIGSFQKTPNHVPQLFEGFHEGAFDLVFPQDKILYSKRFLFQEKPEIHIRQQLEVNNDVLYTPPGVMNQYPLWPYGGYFRLGCSFEEIEQMVFNLSKDSQGLTASVSPLISEISYWKNKPQVFGAWDVVFMDEMSSSHHQSLASDILQGGVCCKLISGRDEEGNPWQQTYKSFRFTLSDPLSHMCEIHFLKA